MSSRVQIDLTRNNSKARVVFLLLAAAIMMIGLSLPLFANEIFLEDDISSTYLPLRYFYAQCLQQGDSFLWIPNIFMGYYLHAEGQNGMAHPLHLALYRYLPFTIALDLELLLSYPFMFAGMFLFLRRLRLSTESALFGALLFAFSGYSMSRWLWFVHMGVLSHTPWALWCIHIAMRSTDRVRVSMASLGVVALTASMLLVGYPQMVYVTGLVEGMYTLFLLPRAPYRRMIGVLLIAKVLGAACAAVQLLPTYDLLGQSARAVTDYGFRMSGSQHPINLIQLVSPYFFHQRMVDGHGYETMYGGAAMAVLALWTLLRFRTLEISKSTVVFCWVAIVLGTLLTMGSHGYLYQWVAKLPIISNFRGTPRHWAMVHIGWVTLSALAYAELSRLNVRGEKVAWKELGMLCALPAISVGLCIFIVVLRSYPESFPALASFDASVAPTRNVFVGAFLMVGATAGVIAVARGMRYGLIALLIFVVADTALYGLRHKTTDNFDTFVESIDVPPGSPEFRYEPDFHPVYSVNGPLIKGYSTPQGIVSIEPARHLDYYLNRTALRLAGTKWMRTREGATPELADAARQGIEWIVIDQPMPRARFVTDAVVSTDFVQDLEHIDMAQTALVTQPLELEPAMPGTAEILRDRPGSITVRTQTETRQLLVLTEAYDDDWVLTIDEQPGEVIPVYGDFLGVVVPTGQHEIELRFDPRSFRLGKTITLFGLFLSILFHLALPRLLPAQKRPVDPNAH